MEIWKDIEGYEGFYQVSNKGRIRNRNGLIKKFRINPSGYKLTFLYKNEYKCFSIHRLVAKAFIPNPNNLPEVNHLNGIKIDNKNENLEWCTKSNNIKHANSIGLINQIGMKNNNSKLTNELIIEIRNKYSTNQYTCRGLAKEYKVSPQLINQVVNKTIWKHIK
jgi:hypothetical protein